MFAIPVIEMDFQPNFSVLLCCRWRTRAPIGVSFSDAPMLTFVRPEIRSTQSFWKEVLILYDTNVSGPVA